MMPPPISKTMSRRLTPIGTSMRPVLATRPARAKTFVPLPLRVPIAWYQAAPLRTMAGMFARVSTLLISVGRPTVQIGQEMVAVGGACRAGPPRRQ